jgi:Tfp pilus assembly PilM family ATPase
MNWRQTITSILPNSRKSVGNIGIEFSRDHIHLVQLVAVSDTETQIQAAMSVEYEQDRSYCFAHPHILKKLVTNALKRGGFKGKKAIVSMPSDKVRLITLTYRVKDKQSEDVAVLDSVANRLSDDISEYVVDYIPVRVKDTDVDHLAVVCVAKRNDVLAFLNLMRGVGLKVTCLEVSPIAIRRLINSIPKKNYRENSLVISFGMTESHMSLLSGRRLLSDQAITFAQGTLLDKISNSVGLRPNEIESLVMQYGFDNDDANALYDIDVSKILRESTRKYLSILIDDINRMLVYAASETRGEQVSQIYILGVMAQWPGFDQFILNAVNIPVTIVDPARAFGEKSNEYSVHESVALAAATGMALRDLRPRKYQGAT